MCKPRIYRALAYLSLLAIGWGTGCGKPPRGGPVDAGSTADGSAAAQSKGSRKKPVEELGVALMGPRDQSPTGLLEPASPESGQDRQLMASLQPVPLDDYELKVTRPLLLPDSQSSNSPQNPELFVTFLRLSMVGSDGQAQAAESATYSVWTKDRGQSPAALGPPQEARLDAGGTRFYFPLSPIFAGRKTHVSPTQTHSIVIDLHFAKSQGRTLEFRIHFQAIGFVPSFDARPAGGIESAGDIGGLEQSLVSNVNGTFVPTETAVYIEEVTNPADRPLSLWLKLDTESLFQAHSVIAHSEWVPQVHSADPANPGCVRVPGAMTLDCHPMSVTHHTLSTAVYRITSLAVSGPGRTVQVIRDPDWTSLVLGAGETLRLEWRIRPLDGTPVCSLTPHVTRELDWDEAWHPCERWNSNFGPCPTREPHHFIAHHSAFIDDNTLAGISVTGNWRRQILITEPIFNRDQIQERSKLEASLRARIRVLADGPRNVSVSAGVLPEATAASPDRCQGVF